MRRVTTAEFIERARQVHGDRYEYDRAVYVNNKRKVIITCFEHGDFEQTPNSHTQGQGCPSCGAFSRAAAQTLTAETFIAKARQVHGDKYDYSKSVYVTNKRKVIITCPEHGDFEQRPKSHTSGIGCPSCGRLATTAAKTLTAETFIAKARAVHGDRYDYARTVYVNRKLKVIITCREHGDFEQRAADHTRGKGCLACSGKGALNTSEFIAKAREMHGDRYEYDRTVYVNRNLKVIITCREHGDFEQLPNDHMRGIGCASCAIAAKRLTPETFIAKAREVHGARYYYSKSVYLGAHTKVTITCTEHGDFEQIPAAHTRGHGCPSCAVTGYQPNKTGYLYFLLDTETNSRIKIGISNRPDQRLRELRNATPFQFEPMEIIETYGEIAPQLEKLCHEALPSAGLTGFDGATEWMKYEGATVHQLIETCESYRLLNAS